MTKTLKLGFSHFIPNMLFPLTMDKKLHFLCKYYKLSRDNEAQIAINIRDDFIINPT